MSERSWFSADSEVLWESDSGKNKTANSWESAFPVGDVLSGLGVYDNPVGTGGYEETSGKNGRKSGKSDAGGTGNII